MIPGSSRFRAALAAGIIATIAGIFPDFAWKLLSFVGLYGTILAPMGVIIFFDWYFHRKRDAENLHRITAAKPYNLAVLFAWLIPVSIAIYFIQAKGISAWYFPLPCWLACGVFFLIFSEKQDSSVSR